MVSIIRTASSHKDFRELVRLLDLDLNTRYGSLQTMYDQYNTSESIETVVIAYVHQIPVGCGGFKPYDQTTAEIKRMYVKPEYRGQGIARRIIAELERWTQERGFSTVILETGRKQAEAIRLYTQNGYRQIENYAPYQGLTNSVCFTKTLTSTLP